MNARFNKKVLKEKIVFIASQKERIAVYNLDVIDFMDQVLIGYPINNLFINFDPPYVKKGPELYLNHFSKEDHEKLRDRVTQFNRYWIITYDFNCEIVDLYNAFRYERIQLIHSAGKSKIGEEILIYSDNLEPN